jgi:hypothetical protein
MRIDEIEELLSNLEAVLKTYPETSLGILLSGLLKQGEDLSSVEDKSLSCRLDALSRTGDSMGSFEVSVITNFIKREVGHKGWDIISRDGHIYRANSEVISFNKLIEKIRVHLSSTFPTLEEEVKRELFELRINRSKQELVVR